MQTKGNWATPPSTDVTKVIGSSIQLYNDYAAPEVRGLLKCHQVRHRGKEMSREQRCGMRDLSALGTRPYSTVPPLHSSDLALMAQALMGRALMGQALMCWALMGRALMAPLG